MAKFFKCPNCGGSAKQKLNEVEFKCIYCNTVFHEEAKPVPVNRIEREYKPAEADSYFDENNYETKKTWVAIAFIVLLGVGCFAFYSTHHSARTQEQVIKEKQDEMERFSRGTEQINYKELENTIPGYEGMLDPERLIDSMQHANEQQRLLDSMKQVN